MSSIEMGFAISPRGDEQLRRAHEKPERWKLAVGIGGAIVGAPLLAIVIVLLIASLLPILLLEVPFLVARSGRTPGPGSPLAAREARHPAQTALPAPSAT